MRRHSGGSCKTARGLHKKPYALDIFVCMFTSAPRPSAEPNKACLHWLAHRVLLTLALALVRYLLSPDVDTSVRSVARLPYLLAFVHVPLGPCLALVCFFIACVIDPCGRICVAVMLGLAWRLVVLCTCSAPRILALPRFPPAAPRLRLPLAGRRASPLLRRCSSAPRRSAGAGHTILVDGLGPASLSHQLDMEIISQKDVCVCV